MLELFSYPEIFFLTPFETAFSALLSGSAVVKGLITGCTGLAMAFVSIDEIFGIFGVPRHTFGQPFLFDGVDLIAAVLALYAIPEMIALLHRKGRKATAAVPSRATDGRGRVLQGLRDIFVHRWMTLRTSLIGAVVGIMLGLGGDVAAWPCYGHAAQTSRQPELCGKGPVEGFTGPGPPAVHPHVSLCMQMRHEPDAGACNPTAVDRVKCSTQSVEDAGTPFCSVRIPAKKPRKFRVRIDFVDHGAACCEPVVDAAELHVTQIGQTHQVILVRGVADKGQLLGQKGRVAFVPAGLHRPSYPSGLTALPA